MSTTHMAKAPRIHGKGRHVFPSQQFVKDPGRVPSLQEAWSQGCVCSLVCLCTAVPVGSLSLVFRFLPRPTWSAPRQTATQWPKGRTPRRAGHRRPGLTWPAGHGHVFCWALCPTFLYQKTEFSPNEALGEAGTCQYFCLEPVTLGPPKQGTWGQLLWPSAASTPGTPASPLVPTAVPSLGPTHR